MGAKLSNLETTTMKQGDDCKRRKLNEVKQLQCQYFITKKNRYCPLGAKPDQKYCVHHRAENDFKHERVPCPFDPKHSVWKKSLEAHLAKCNSKPRETREYWYELDFNIDKTTQEDDLKGVSHEDEGNLNVNLKGDHDLKVNLEDKNDLKGINQEDEDKLMTKYINVLQKIEFVPLETKIRHHDGLNDKLSKVSIQKHAIQQSSLIGNMKSEQLLQPNNFYVEFGCGKAELSRFINFCVLKDLVDDENVSSCYGFGLIDRGLNRMKNDSKIKSDSIDHKSIVPRLKRSRIDIKDLNLDKFVEDINPSKVVAVSKHLCGAATDLTIKSILNSNLVMKSDLKSPVFHGMLIAMCCRHVCDYKLLLPESKLYLASKGFENHQSFSILKKIASWAVCGRKNDNESSQEKIIDKDIGNTKLEITKEDNHSLGLNYNERELLGLKARRLIDESRLSAITRLFPNYNLKLFIYADASVTLENVCLCMTRK